MSQPVRRPRRRKNNRKTLLVVIIPFLILLACILLFANLGGNTEGESSSRESSFTASTRPRWTDTVGTCRTTATAFRPVRCADSKIPLVST